MPRVDDRDNAVEPQALSQFGTVESLDDGRGIGQAGRFDEHVVKAFLALQQIGEALDQIPAHPAAQTAVVQFEDFFVDARRPVGYRC
jgi:hypothetical protein